MPQLSLSWLGLGPMEASPWVLLLLVGASWLLARSLTWIYAFYEKSRRLQCFPQPPKRNWLLGHVGMIQPTEQGLKEVSKLVGTYPQGFMTWLGPIIPIVTLCHPNIVRSVLSASDPGFRRRSAVHAGSGEHLWGCVLLVGGALEPRGPHLPPHLHQAGALCSSCGCTEGCDLLQLPEALAGKPSEYIAAILELSALVVKRNEQLLMHMDFLYLLSPSGQRFRKACRLVHDFTDAVIQERRRTLPDHGISDFLKAKAESKTLDFIDVLLLTKDEDGKELSDEDIRAEADTFMFEGHDTTASGLSWALYNLAKHPEYQERCRKEVQDLLRDRDPKEIEWDDLAQLPFLTMCIKESLRLHPPVTVISRCCTQDVVLPDGRVIPKGVTCLISIFGTHHNPAVWPNPEVYDPFRFDPENAKDRSPLAFIPFSAGPRNCIGQTFAMSEMKVVLALTLLRFRVLPDDTEPRRKPELILRAEGGLWLRVEPLSSGA
nr:cytochrome P450 4F2 isoform X3 [Marmota flaviventris]